MTANSSATTRRETPHANRTTRTATIINALKRGAEAVLNDPSLDPQSRAVLRYALETNDPWLAKMVRRADAGEPVVETIDSVETADAIEDVSTEHKVQALAEIICRGGDESAGALFVLMGTLQDSEHPEVIANTVKHLAFTRCGELNLNGMVDAQISMLENELLAGDVA